MLLKALMFLRPNSEFTINNNDLSTIVWHTEGIITPTQEEVDAVILQMEADEQNKISALESAIAKLQALGLTVEEAKAIGGIN